MTQRSMLVGEAPYVIVRAGGGVAVEGVEGDRMHASTDSRQGLKVEQRSESEIGRARAVVGDHVLFDVRLDVRNPLKTTVRRMVTEITFRGSGKVQVPFGSSVKVYAGKSVEVQNIQGSGAIYAGADVRVRNLHTLVHVAAGGSIDLECDEIDGDDVKFVAGRDLRCCIKNLSDAKVMVKDLGGYWEGVVGNGRIRIRLKAGGDVTLVTDQDVKAQPPYYKMGNIERSA